MKKYLIYVLIFYVSFLKAQEKTFVQIDSKTKTVVNILVLDSNNYKNEEQAVIFLNKIYGSNFLFKECFYNKKPFYPVSNNSYYDILQNCFISEKPKEGNYIFNSKTCQWEEVIK